MIWEQNAYLLKFNWAFLLVVGEGRSREGVTLLFEGMATRMVAPVLKPKNNINHNVCLSSPTYAAQEAVK
jgi:hypothetical protein